MAKQLLFYETVVPISAERHGGWSLEKKTDYSFTAEINACPLMVSEFRAAAASMPIVFGASGGGVVPAVILGSVWTFNMFNIIYLVSAGQPDGSTEILISEAYRWAFTRQARYGYAAAYAVLIFLVLLGYSRLGNRIAGRKVL